MTWAALAATPSATKSAAAQAAGTPRVAGQAKVRKVKGPVQPSVHMAVSKQIIGDAIGVDGPTQECWSCRLAGHCRGECPADYGNWVRHCPFSPRMVTRSLGRGTLQNLSGPRM